MSDVAAGHEADALRGDEARSRCTGLSQDAMYMAWRLQAKKLVSWLTVGCKPHAMDGCGMRSAARYGCVLYPP